MEFSVLGSHPKTFRSIRAAPGATPLESFECVPDNFPAATAATRVPWPTTSQLFVDAVGSLAVHAVVFGTKFFL